MSKVFHAGRLDVAAFAQAQARLAGRDPLSGYARVLSQLHAEPAAESTLEWGVQGSYRRAVDGSHQPALQLRASANLPLTCQRCLGQVMVPIEVDRHVVFMPDEDTAAALDDASEDDLMALVNDLDLHQLIEDEVLLALPLVPRHEQCPQPVTLSVADADFDAGSEDRPNPFAALAALKKTNPN